MKENYITKIVFFLVANVLCFALAMTFGLSKLYAQDPTIKISEDLKYIDEDYKKLEEFYKESLKKAGKKGERVRYYKSDVDGSIQPFGLSVPESYDPQNKTPLFIHLHGVNRKLVAGNARTTWTPGFKYWQAENIKETVILAMPFARGNNGYTGLGEVDIFEVTELVKSEYNIDENRVYLLGFSMGGGGTMKTGTHYPDQYAAIFNFSGAVRGTTDAEYSKKFNITENSYNALMLLKNANNIPVYIRVGTKDRLLEANRNLKAALEQLGQDPNYDEYPGLGHVFMNEIPFSQDAPQILQYTRNPYPKKVYYRTDLTRWSKNYWLSIDQVEQLGWAEIELEADKNNIFGTINNVNEFSVYLNEELFDLSKAVNIRVNDKLIYSEVPDKNNLKLSFRKHKDSLTLIDHQRDGLYKKPGLQGPVYDAFLSRFLVVYGSEEDRIMAELEMKRYSKPFTFTGSGSSVTHADFRFKSAGKISEQDIAENNLILFGDAESNPVIKKISDDLPIEFRKNYVKVNGKEYKEEGTGIVMVYPNPLNQNKYIVVYTGQFTESFNKTDKEGGSGIRGLGYPKLPDFTVFNTKTKEKNIISGMFDNDWKVNQEFILE